MGPPKKKQKPTGFFGYVPGCLVLGSNNSLVLLTSLTHSLLCLITEGCTEQNNAWSVPTTTSLFVAIVISHNKELHNNDNISVTGKNIYYLQLCTNLTST